MWLVTAIIQEHTNLIMSSSDLDKDTANLISQYIDISIIPQNLGTIMNTKYSELAKEHSKILETELTRLEVLLVQWVEKSITKLDEMVQQREYSIKTGITTSPCVKTQDDSRFVERKLTSFLTTQYNLTTSVYLGEISIWLPYIYNHPSSNIGHES